VLPYSACHEGVWLYQPGLVNAAKGDMIGQPSFSGRSAKVEARDPVTGEHLWLTAYLRNDRLVLQRLRGQVGTHERSPKQLTELVRFGKAAYAAFDQPKSGKLPPAAERVAATRRSESATNLERVGKEKRKRPDPSNPNYYRALLGEQPVSQIEAMLKARLALGASR
jgi:hypothetical protein